MHAHGMRYIIILVAACGVYACGVYALVESATEHIIYVHF